MKKIDMKTANVVLCSLMLASNVLNAQDKQIVEIQYSKKIINVPELGLSEATPISIILSTVPELIGRDEETMFENFDIQFDGKSTGSGRDAILFQTTAGEVKKIEISTNPTVSQQKNGQCGSINIIPRDISEGFSGVVMAEATTEYDVIPKLLLNYKKNKFELRGNVNMEYFNPSQIKETITRIPQERSVVTRVDSTMERYFQQTVGINLLYKISEKDEVKAWVFESWHNDCFNGRTSIVTDMDKALSEGAGWHFIDRKYAPIETSQNNLATAVTGEYTHKFNQGEKFNTSINYNYGRNVNGTNVDIPNSIVFEGKFENIKLLDKNDNKMFLKAGLNANFNSGSTNDGVIRSASTLSAFTELKYTNKCLTANLGVRYLYHDRYFASKKIHGTRSNDDDVTASLAAVWKIQPHHALKFAASRNLIRPTDEMLYPGIIPALMEIGNPQLKNTYVHNIELGYNFDWSENAHSLAFNFITGYDRTDGIIEKVITTEGLMGEPYSTFRNSGISNILKDNLSLIYKHGIFTLSFGANFFYNIKLTGNAKGYHGYYNLNLTPTFNLPSDWNVSGILTYNSAVLSDNAILGDRFYASVSLGKTLGSWTFDLIMGDIFGWRSTDESFIGRNTVEETTYNARSRYAGVFVAYKF